MIGNLPQVASLAVAGALLLASLATAEAPARLRGLSLEQAIKVLEQNGVTVIYSSALVKPWMRIRTEPRDAPPERMLAEILAPFGLRGQTTPQGLTAIVREKGPRSVQGTAAPGPEVRRASTAHRQSELPLEEVVVAASQYELTGSLTEPRTSLSGTDIEHIPDLGDDSLRAVGRVPGAAGNGLSARTHIRGGEAGETLVRLDGERLYNPFHLKDFHSVFSAIDPRIVSTVDVYTGGFSARFGDRMSGVLDITSLTPPAPRYRELSLSFFNTSALSSGQFDDGRGGWVASFRRSNLDVWYHALRDTPGTPTYQDAFGKVSYQVNPQLRLTGSMLYSTDEIGLAIDDNEELATADYKDHYHWLRADYRPNDALKGVVLVSHAGLRGNRTGFIDQPGVGSGSLRDARSFRIDSVTSEWTWYGGDTWLVEFGGELKRARGLYDFRENVEFDVLLDTPGAPDSASRNRALRVEPERKQHASYASVRSVFPPRLTTDIGLRWESEHVSPRFGARYEIARHTFVRANFGRVYQSQAVDELQAADGVTSFFQPQQTDYASIGVEHLFAGGVELRAEIYHKRLRHLRPRYENLINSLTLVPELHPDRVLVAPTSGRVRGVELLLSSKNDGPWTWWLGYSASSAKERLGGSDVVRSWDQTHAVSAGINWTRNDWVVGAAIIDHSGWPTTDVHLASEDAVPVLGVGARNAGRAPRYRSADVRIERRFTLDRSTVSAFVEVANVLGRDNVCCFSYEIDDETGGLELERRNYAPRIPSLGFLWQF